MDQVYSIEYSPPGPVAEAFINSTAFVAGIKGPIGCLAGESLIITSAGPRRIDSLDRPTQVLSWDDRAGQFRFALASAAYVKGKDVLYRVRGQHGEVRAAADHLVFCADGTYRRVESLLPGQSVSQYSVSQIQTSSGYHAPLQIDALRLMRIVADLKERCGSLFRQCGLQPRYLEAADRLFFPLQLCAQGVEVSAITGRTRLGQLKPPLQTNGCLPQVGGLLGDLAGALQGLCERTGRYSVVSSLSLLIEDAIASVFRLSGATYGCSLSKGAIISVTRCEGGEEYWDLQVADTNNYVTVDGMIHHNSGKSVAACMRIFRKALSQAPGDDGVARSRVVIVRNTFPELKSTTIKTWLSWFPEEVFGKVRWDSPITHVLRLADDRVLEAVFLALDRPQDVKKLLSLETTWLWINEVRELPKAVLDAATGRVGRYPDPKSGAAAFEPSLQMDTNSMDDDHWYYTLAEKEKPEGYEFFSQPGGLDPGAENLDWLSQTTETLALPCGHPDRQARGRIYYHRMIPGKKPEWIKVYVHNEYASVSDGKMVYHEFNERVHVSERPLVPYTGQALYLGWDFGLTPAVVIGQQGARGQLRILGELWSDNADLTQFCDEVVLPHLASKYPNYRVFSPHDPAGTQRSQTDGVTCRRILKMKGLNPVTAASNNDFEARRGAVGHFLTLLVEGEPALWVDPSCKRLIKGMGGGYRFRRILVSGEERYHDKVEKNLYSHVCEALQYLCLLFYNPAKAGQQADRGQRTLQSRARISHAPATRAGY